MWNKIPRQQHTGYKLYRHQLTALTPHLYILQPARSAEIQPKHNLNIGTIPFPHESWLLSRECKEILPQYFPHTSHCTPTGFPWAGASSPAASFCNVKAKISSQFPAKEHPGRPHAHPRGQGNTELELMSFSFRIVPGSLLGLAFSLSHTSQCRCAPKSCAATRWIQKLSLFSLLIWGFFVLFVCM